MGATVNVVQPVTRVWVELACGHHHEVSFQGTGAREYRVSRELPCDRCAAIVAPALGHRFLREGDPVIPVDINEPPNVPRGTMR